MGEGPASSGWSSCACWDSVQDPVSVPGIASVHGDKEDANMKTILDITDHFQTDDLKN